MENTAKITPFVSLLIVMNDSRISQYLQNRREQKGLFFQRRDERFDVTQERFQKTFVFGLAENAPLQ